VPLTFPDCIAFLGDRLKQPLPGWDAQSRMAPAGRRRDGSPAAGAGAEKRSGVLILLYPRGGEVQFLLIERAHGGNHGGQIALPGGKFERADGTVARTALRETEEETGIQAAGVSLIGPLSDLFIPVSGYRVFPVVGYMASTPVLRPNPVEVRRVIEAGLRHFLEEDLVRTGRFPTKAGRKEAPFYDYEGHRIWGATSMILSEFISLFR